jgi:hypothetical protein
VQAKVHKEMAYQVIADFPNPNLLEFLLDGVAKPEWKKDQATKIRWVKEWMDMPDNSHHSSKQKNDHSYKLMKTDKGFKIKFIGNRADQATVVARLKYAARDIREWKVEEEPRVAALELAKSIHWVIDFSTPPHTIADWDDDLHGKVETDFDKMWVDFYKKAKIDFTRKDQIKDIYRWAKAFIEEKYDRGYELLKIYRAKGSMKDGQGQQLGREVILDVAQNLADYLSWLDRMIDYEKMLKMLNPSS